MQTTTALAIAIDPALTLLPAAMRSKEARAMLLAIGLQESRLSARQQIGGPARGYWQFEPIGVEGVLTHHTTRRTAAQIVERLDYTPADVYEAIAFDRVLAAAFARLALYPLPLRLPGRGGVNAAWSQYIAAWRPGKPHRKTWAAFYVQAWDTVDCYDEGVTDV